MRWRKGGWAFGLEVGAAGDVEEGEAWAKAPFAGWASYQWKTDALGNRRDVWGFIAAGGESSLLPFRAALLFDCPFCGQGGVVRGRRRGSQGWGRRGAGGLRSWRGGGLLGMSRGGGGVRKWVENGMAVQPFARWAIRFCAMAPLFPFRWLWILCSAGSSYS